MAPIVPALGKFNVLGVERCRLGKYSCSGAGLTMVNHSAGKAVEATAPADCRVHKGGHRLRTCFDRDRGAMIVNRALADTEVGGDVLSGMPGKDEVQDLMLPIGQTCHPNGR